MTWDATVLPHRTEQEESQQAALVAAFECGEMRCGGDDVIARLAAVNVVVGMDAPVAASTAQEFGGAVREDLVGVHVG